jgi:hypothetical protein
MVEQDEMRARKYISLQWMYVYKVKKSDNQLQENDRSWELKIMDQDSSALAALSSAFHLRLDS